MVQTLNKSVSVYGDMMKSADIGDLKSLDGNIMWVQLPLSPPTIQGGTNMDSIALTTSDIEFILKWRDEHADYVRSGIAPLKNIKIVCPESGIAIIASRNKEQLELAISQDHTNIGKMLFKVKGNGLYSLTADTTSLNEDDKQSILSVYASTMALLVFGRTSLSYDRNAVCEIVKDSTPNTQHKRGQQHSYTYILKKYTGTIQTSKHTHHKSPEGIFSVRGHYRHYKDGKTVWIAEYTKGNGTKRDKTYRLGATVLV